jgi:2-oxoglutarate-Fe(II)-dependent oxygenase superfamily protein
MTVHNRFIVALDGALDTAFCESVVARMESDDGGPTSKCYEINHQKKSCVNLDIGGLPEWADIEVCLRQSLNRGMKHYADHNESLASVERLVCHAFRLRRYNPGDFFDWHIDSYNRDVSGRVLACVWYLNDVRSGGATEFLYQNVAVEARRGRLLMFPTGFEYVHRSSPVIEGQKYVALSFVEHA